VHQQSIGVLDFQVVAVGGFELSDAAALGIHPATMTGILDRLDAVFFTVVVGYYLAIQLVY